MPPGAVHVTVKISVEFIGADWKNNFYSSGIVHKVVFDAGFPLAAMLVFVQLPSVEDVWCHKIH